MPEEYTNIKTNRNVCYFKCEHLKYTDNSSYNDFAEESSIQDGKPYCKFGESFLYGMEFVPSACPYSLDHLIGIDRNEVKY